ncbi:MAG: universal stress protein [Desulfobacterales bacterium]
MRTLHCPLLVIRGPEHDLNVLSDQMLNFQKILVGCDFSEDSDLAFQYALSLAQEFQSELHLVHVKEPAVYAEWLKLSVELEEVLYTKLNDKIKEKLDKMVPEEACNWCLPKIEILEGKPNEELIRYARENKISLIVLGVRGQGLVERMFVGSTTDRVIREAPCPVLSVCSKG